VTLPAPPGALALALLATLASGVGAGEGGAERPPLCHGNFLGPASTPLPTTPSEVLELLADEADLRQSGATTVTGRVVARRGGRTLEADSLTYYREADRLEVLDGVRYRDPTVYLSAVEAEIDAGAGTGWLGDVHYRLVGQQGRGDARAVHLGEQGWMLVDRGSYTTCDPGDDAWSLQARELTLDRATDLGTARGVTLELGGVPVFYTPYLDFPLSGARKSGLLPPTIGSSDRRGLELALPYYWNIAPEQDATLGLREMSRRGAMLQGEYRFLTERGPGELQAEYLPDDHETGDDRGMVRYRHRYAFSGRSQLEVDAATASDSAYLSDFGNGLSVSNTQFLERRAVLSTGGTGWSALARLQDFQTMDATIARSQRPYARLPQVLLSAERPAERNGLDLGLRAELAEFTHADRVQGTRVDLWPSLAYPVRTDSSFLVPRVSLRHTAYALQDSDAGSSGDPRPAGSSDSPQRTLPIVSLDSGLLFERELTLGGRALVQTLEPRAYYLYVPEEDQDDLPVFDTEAYTFGFPQLFRENRFSGADRVGDANQLTLALTTQLQDWRTGRALGQASIGQIRYFHDPRVGLPDLPAEQGTASDLAAEVAALLGSGWSVRSSWLWDTGDHRTERATVAGRYQPAPDRLVNFGYRYLRETVDQTDLSFHWQLSPRWGMVGRWSHEIPTGKMVETFAGVEYETCCWGVRAVARRYLASEADEVEADYTQGVFLQLELKGLGGLGADTVGFLREQIPGYENHF
jgi:LPS-assembly protein